MMKGKVRSRIIDRKKKFIVKTQCAQCCIMYILHKMYTRLNVLFCYIYIIIYIMMHIDILDIYI